MADETQKKKKTPTKTRSANKKSERPVKGTNAPPAGKPAAKTAPQKMEKKMGKAPSITNGRGPTLRVEPESQGTSEDAQNVQGQPLEISASRQFNAWIQEQRLSIGFTTYQTGKVFFIGLKANGRLSVFERTFNRCMGLCIHDDSLYMSSLYQLWRFKNVLPEGKLHEGYDRVYVPINGHTTGDLDIHDIALDDEGRIIFVNTLFSCLSVINFDASFSPIWQPPFISKIAAEDRCHLNGLAMENGQPRYVTVVGEADVPDGWRGKRTGGGCIIDVQSNEIIARGLSMPHSPRVYRDKLYVLNSGTGEFGSVDPSSGEFQPITFCPGYLRGLSFHGDYAIVGLSKPRENKTFSGLPLDTALSEKNAEAQCGIYIIDLNTGDVVHWLQMEGMIQELYDVIFLEDVIRPMAYGFKTDEIRRTFIVGDTISL